MEPLLLPILESAKALGVSRTKVYQLIGDGLLDVVKIGRRSLIRVASIRAMAGERLDGRMPSDSEETTH